MQTVSQDSRISTRNALSPRPLPYWGGMWQGCGAEGLEGGMVLWPLPLDSPACLSPSRSLSWLQGRWAAQCEVKGPLGHLLTGTTQPTSPQRSHHPSKPYSRHHGVLSSVPALPGL